MIFKQSISYRFVFIIWFYPDQDHRKGVIKVWLRVVSYFSFGHGRMRARASGERQSREKRGMTDILFAIYWCSCVSISFIFSIIP